MLVAPWPMATAVVGMTRATARPPKAWEMSSARTPAATETIMASGARWGATASAASRQVCGFTANSTVLASPRTESGGLSRAPDAASAWIASPGLGSRMIRSRGWKAAARRQPSISAPPMRPAPSSRIGVMRALGLADRLEHAGGDGVGGRFRALHQEVEGREEAIRRFHGNVDHRRGLGERGTPAGHQRHGVTEDDLAVVPDLE